MKWTHQEIDDLTRKLLTPRQLERLRQIKSVDVSVSSGNARLRVNVFSTAHGISMAIRILPGCIPTIEELNLHPSLHDISRIKSGLVLICGPAGVGKTTTIAAIINDINKSRPVHIVTLEDPIEYRFQSNKAFIEQRELSYHIPSFEQGLIDVLRDDAEAVKWYSKAAEQGDANAQYNLGLMYNSGEGIPRDDAEAVKWWRKAAEKGLAAAQCILDKMKDK